ncbi:PLP-dependent aminotransferase family protein [Caulobacter segnis]|uniref:MocR-like pyridoxine biosynthesis transcription factor PdxR n=1 Tax=Caulobacter segnis TaxID=88688 RepID=UPI00240EADA3|nr:PLP-dependent aminotransferase family protein [Caulobacter segnis]MDG2523017.1 PLP-dependent aminotransferase family protein [Caulobacter segnis]
MLRPWSISLSERIDATRDMPLYLQIVYALIHEIQRGRLMPGAFLPSSRELARTLQVNRKTIVLAYEDLIAQGWLQSDATRGTRVASNLPDQPFEQPGAGAPGAAEYRFNAVDGPPFVLSGGDALTFDQGTPDARLFPTDLLARAYRDAIVQANRRNRLRYGDPRGSLILRQALADMLAAQRGLQVGVNNICLTRGSQMGVALAARALLKPGDVVLMEALTYAPAAQAFRAAGAQVIGLPLDADGIDVDAVEKACRAHPVRAVFLTPHHQFPTTVALRPERRLRLLELARQFAFAVIEDDYDHEYHFESQPLLPMASYAPNRVIYVGSLSKLTLPSLRVGYVVAPEAVIDAMAHAVMSLDRQGNLVTEEAVAELMDSGELRRHIRKTQVIYDTRRRAFDTALARTFGETVQYQTPDGGLAFWLTFPDPAVLDRIDANGAAAGVRFAPSNAYSLNSKGERGLRLGFASLTDEEAADGLARIKVAAGQT